MIRLIRLERNGRIFENKRRTLDGIWDLFHYSSSLFARTRELLEGMSLMFVD